MSFHYVLTFCVNDMQFRLSYIRKTHRTRGAEGFHAIKFFLLSLCGTQDQYLAGVRYSITMLT
jgi:hypothetical protein